MGDAPDAAILNLLIPGILVPILLLPKLLLLLLPRGATAPIRPAQVLLLTLLESAAPLGATLSSFPVFLVVTFAAPELVENRSFRTGLFLILLLALNALLDGLFLARVAKLRRLTLPLALVFGALASGIFVAAWIGLGNWLLRG